MIVVEGGSYDVTGVLESARCYLKNLQVFRIEEDMNNNQFIIATHSPHIAGAVENNSLRLFVNENNQIKVAEIKSSVQPFLAA